MLKGIGFMAVLAALAGCAETRYVEVPARPVVAESPALRACVAHASAAQAAVYGSDFSMLQVLPQGMVVTAPRLPVGKQQVSAVFDGEGQWFGPREYRRVRFHCMISPAGQVVYSFVRGM